MSAGAVVVVSAGPVSVVVVPGSVVVVLVGTVVVVVDEVVVVELVVVVLDFSTWSMVEAPLRTRYGSIAAPPPGCISKWR